MKDIMNSFSQKELQLLYAACMSYGNKLSDMAKEVPNETEIKDSLADKAKEAWQLARKITNISDK